MKIPAPRTRPRALHTVAFLLLATWLAQPRAQAQEPAPVGPPEVATFLPGAAASPISAGVSLPAGQALLMTSGTVPPILDEKAPAGSPGRYGDTKTQGIGALRQIEVQLKKAGLGFKDVAYLRVYIAADKAKEGRFDYPGWFEAYGQFFNTPENPVKPARSTVGVASLVNPDWLIEIEAVAAYPANAAVAAAAPAPPAAAAAAPSAKAAPILILGAVPQEIVLLVAALKDHRTSVAEGIPCDTGTIGGHEVVIALTGVGKTNSAMVTAALLGSFHPSAALITGTAARIRPGIRTGDIIIATNVSFHDAGSLTAGGMVQGKMDDGGHLTTTEWFSPTRGRMNPFSFADSPELVAFAAKLAATYQPPAVDLDGETYVPAVRTGTVATGDLSGVTEAKIADVRAKLDPDLMEMESAAFAQVCQFFQVPHLIIRSGSNVAEERNNDDYLRLSPIAAKQAALFTLEIAGKMP